MTCGRLETCHDVSSFPPSSSYAFASSSAGPMKLLRHRYVIFGQRFRIPDNRRGISSKAIMEPGDSSLLCKTISESRAQNSNSRIQGPMSGLWNTVRSTFCLSMKMRCRRRLCAATLYIRLILDIRRSVAVDSQCGRENTPD